MVVRLFFGYVLRRNNCCNRSGQLGPCCNFRRADEQQAAQYRVAGVWWQASDASESCGRRRRRFGFFCLAQMSSDNMTGRRLAINVMPGKPHFKGLGAAEPSPEHVARRGRGLGVGTRVYVHQRSLEYDGRA